MEVIHELEGHTDRVWDVSWCPITTTSGKTLLASCSSDKTVRIWEGGLGSTWTCKEVLNTHTRTVRCCHWSPNGKLLAAASFDGSISIWEAVGAEFLSVTNILGHENEIKSVVWSPSGSLLMSTGRDKTVWIWQMQELESSFEFEPVAVLEGHSQDVKTALFHPSKEGTLVSASYDNTIKVWVLNPEGDDFICVQTLSEETEGHSSTVWKISFDATGDRMVSCSDDKLFIVWDTSTEPLITKWKHLCTISGYHDRTIYSVDWSRNSGLVVSGAGDDAICVFSDLESNVPGFSMVTKKEHAHDSDVNCVRWHPKEPNVFASAGDDKLIKLWKL